MQSSDKKLVCFSAWLQILSVNTIEVSCSFQLLNTYRSLTAIYVFRIIYSLSKFFLFCNVLTMLKRKWCRSHHLIDSANISKNVKLKVVCTWLWICANIYIITFADLCCKLLFWANKFFSLVRLLHFLFYFPSLSHLPNNLTILSSMNIYLLWRSNMTSKCWKAICFDVFIVMYLAFWDWQMILCILLY